MATKEDRLFLKHQQNSVIDQFHILKSSQFSELNLNQGHKCSNDESSLHSFNKSNKDKNFGCTVFSEKGNSWNKSATKDLSFKTLKNQSFNVESKKRLQKRWMNEKNDSSNSRSSNGSSTLSLHIAAYENFVEASANEDFSIKSKAFNTAVTVPVSKFQDPYEFPRQMDGNKRSTPEIQQFGAGQKLLTPNQEKPILTKQVCALPYYHGLLPREDIKSMLKQDGDFLLRITEPTAGQPRSVVLSVCDPRDNARHYVIQSDGTSCFIEPHQKHPDVILLIRAYHRITLGGTVLLKNPILRQPWELNHEDIECTKKIGEGAFGEVSLGRLQLKGEKVEVAIKLAKLESLTKEQIKEIMLEARLMRMFDHPNIIKLYGVAAGQEPLMLVMELADKGALDSYLQKNTISNEKKMEMCAQASFGLEYLHHMNVLHCDIAARNCLYGNGKVKISDFGLTREGQTYEMLPTKRVPIRWLAPETMVYYIYNQKTDIYSFGILCWEIWHNGQEPYPGFTVAEVHGKVKEGYRMTLPPQIPNNVRIVILNCWGLPDKRWSANDVAKKFEEISGLKMPDYLAAEEKKKQQAQVSSSSNGPGKRKKLKTRESRDSVEQEPIDEKPQRNKNSAGNSNAGGGRRNRSASN